MHAIRRSMCCTIHRKYAGMCSSAQIVRYTAACTSPLSSYMSLTPTTIFSRFASFSCSPSGSAGIIISITCSVFTMISTLPRKRFITSTMGSRMSFTWIVV